MGFGAVRFSHDQRIARAKELAGAYPAAREMLDFYQEIARFQKGIFEDVTASGETQVESLAGYFPEFLNLLRKIGPKSLAESGSRIADPGALLEECWSGKWPDDWFFGRALVQPFAEALAARSTIDEQWTGNVCPFCGSWPVAVVLRGEGGGAKRWLLCSLCSVEWQFRRILCWNCREEDKEKLPVYTASEYSHVRVEACDTCRIYNKAVDLTIDGRAVPVVDDIATVDLDIWAEEHGYDRLATNIVGT